MKEDQNEEGTLLDALEKDLVGSPEASQVDPTALGFAPENGFGSRGQSPTILGTIVDPGSASARQDAQPPSNVEDELPVWFLAKRCVHPSEEQEDFKVRTQNKFEVLVPQEICNVKPELEAFDLTMADSDIESAEWVAESGVCEGPQATPGRSCVASFVFLTPRCLSRHSRHVE